MKLKDDEIDTIKRALTDALDRKSLGGCWLEHEDEVKILRLLLKFKHHSEFNSALASD